MYTFKIVIADDEAFIRGGLLKLVGQMFQNAAVTGVYTNGADVLAHLAREEVDILITDIRMPNVSGLDAARYIWEKKLVTKVIIITGYQDFEYARLALEYQIEHLILKPINPEKMLECISKIMNDIGARVRKIHDDTSHRLLLRDVRRQHFAALIAGELQTPAMRAQSAPLRGNDPKYTGWCAVVKLETESDSGDASSRTEQFWRDSSELQDDFIDVYLIAGAARGATLLLLSGCADEAACRAAADSFAAGLCRDLGNIYGLRCKYKISLYESPEELPRKNSGGLSDMYIEHILHGDAGSRRALIKTAAQACNSRQLGAFIRKSAQRLGELYNLSLDHIAAQADSQAVKEDLVESLNKLDEIVERDLSGRESVIVKIIHYISENLSYEITLDSVAEKFNFSRSHLSRMFKRETGERFVDFLINMRVQKAKELLQSGKYSVKEIAYRVGYANPRYFSMTFREKTGMSPREYRAE